MGRNLAEYLGAKKADCRVFAARHADLDLLDETAVKKYIAKNKIDLILHCANCGGNRKTGYDAGAVDVVDRNLRMFFNLARAMPAKCRMINMGSGAEYSRAAYRHKMREEYFDCNVPADSYGYSKYVISKYIGNAKNITTLRIFGLYGKYEDYTFKFISNAIVKNLLGLPIVINQNVKFDYLWIEDFCRLVEKFIEIDPKCRHYNITPTSSIDLITLAGLVNAAGSTKSAIKVLTPGMNTEYTGSNSRMLKELGRFSFTSYAEGIKQLHAYYAAHLNGLDLKTVKKDPYLKLCK